MTKARITPRVTKGNKFRATIVIYEEATPNKKERLIDQIETTVGGANWYNSTTRPYHTIILQKCNEILHSLFNELNQLKND